MPNDWLNDQRHIPLDYPVHDVHLRLQRQVLHMFFDPHRLARIIDNGLLSHESLTLAELFETVRSHLWSELDLPTPRINSFRRNAQRAHLDMLTSLLVDEKVDSPHWSYPAREVPGDARALARDQLERLSQQAGLRLARARALDQETRAHLSDVKVRIEQVLEGKSLPHTRH
jgi:hypothetical protein